jgi:hypothetical protein
MGIDLLGVLKMASILQTIFYRLRESIVRDREIVTMAVNEMSASKNSQLF